MKNSPCTPTLALETNSYRVLQRLYAGPKKDYKLQSKNRCPTKNNIGNNINLIKRQLFQININNYKYH